MEIDQGSASEGGMVIGEPIVGGTDGSVLFVATGSVLGQDNANFFWDDINNRLGLGTNSPTNRLHLFGDGTTLKLQGIGNSNTAIDFIPGGSDDSYQFGAASGGFSIYNLTDSRYDIAVTGAGMVGIGTVTPATKLAVVDSASNNGFEVDPISTANIVYLQSYNRSSGYKAMYLDASEIRLRPGGSNFGSFSSSGANFTAQNSSQTPLTVKGSSSQSATLQEWQDSSGNVLASVAYSGRVLINPHGVFVPTAGFITAVGSTNTTTAYFKNISTILNTSYGVYIEAGTGAGDNAFQINNAAVNTTFFYVQGDGNIGINTNAPTAKLDVNSNLLRLRTAKTPSSSSDSGNQGDFAWDSGYLYICIATNTWQRVATATW